MLLLPGFTVRSPCCPQGAVTLRQVEWQDGPYRRRSTWVDEPLGGLRCVWGCALTGEQVIRLLLAADRQPMGRREPYQLSLGLELEAA